MTTLIITLIIIGIVVLVGLFVIPTKVFPAKKPEGCTCPHYGHLTMEIDYDCPIHGDWR
jgi:hypothetical protein